MQIKCSLKLLQYSQHFIVHIAWFVKGFDFGVEVSEIKHKFFENKWKDKGKWNEVAMLVHLL